MSLETVLYFVAGALVVCGLQAIWFNSNFPIHIFKLLRLIREEDDVYTWDEWQIWLVTRRELLGELLTCSVCLSVWMSLGCALLQHLVLGAGNSPWYVVCATLAWPGISFYLRNTKGYYPS